jgi:putative hydrolase of HD superfamily
VPGWVRAGIGTPESVADHSWGMALLAIVLCPDDLDRERVLALAIVHDLAEVRVGDITPDEMPRDVKRERERIAAASLLREHPKLWALWEDYEQARSPEAKFVHELDKLEMGSRRCGTARRRSSSRARGRGSRPELGH